MRRDYSPNRHCEERSDVAISDIQRPSAPHVIVRRGVFWATRQSPCPNAPPTPNRHCEKPVHPPNVIARSAIGTTKQSPLPKIHWETQKEIASVSPRPRNDGTQKPARHPHVIARRDGFCPDVAISDTPWVSGTAKERLPRLLPQARNDGLGRI